ncbi:L-lactate dehydrogenase complex protein LldG [Halomicrobium zhouii]|uniref:L-lactate dehydrogenase complex protein LldG n=1 Tax=Halomicrobium zhouii TaxID=767519 RepID=A0A1I6L5G0_9EURY|nr:LUD domain-containing protein [Halomicrobium zhouii]SFR98715.1 L-lactate dehydrogenase complex protein LldG [Halomicrobium zhouii]
MATSLTSFEDALIDHDCQVTRTTVEEFDAALGDALREPAVGVPLDDPALSLPAAVETNPTPAQLQAAASGVTPVAFAVADRGTVAIPSTANGVEPVSLYPDCHVAVVRAEQVVPDTDAAFDELGPALADERDSIIMATGPSATGDMGALVTGVHGPSEVHVVVVDPEVSQS